MKPLLFRILYFLRILKLFPQFYFHYEVRKYVRRGDTVIDIGANWGCYTRIFKSCGAKVYAVEPTRRFLRSLFDIPDICVHTFALGNEFKTVWMEHYHKGSGWYRISDKGENNALMVQGSVLFKDLNQINFIKIDVEGSELPIIEDMAELILKHKPIILIETGQIDLILSFLPGYKIIDQLYNDYLIGVYNK